MTAVERMFFPKIPNDGRYVSDMKSNVFSNVVVFPLSLWYCLF